MHHSITQALWEIFPPEEKGDFFHAYLNLKHLNHFMYHALKATGSKPAPISRKPKPCTRWWGMRKRCKLPRSRCGGCRELTPRPLSLEKRGGAKRGRVLAPPLFFEERGPGGEFFLNVSTLVLLFPLSFPKRGG